MSNSDEENELDGQCDDDEKDVQWSSFKEYNHLSALGINLNHDAVKSVIEDAFPAIDQEKGKHVELKQFSLQEHVPGLFLLLYGSESCCSGSISHENTCSQTMTAECIAKREGAIYKWKGLLQSLFETKRVRLSELKWRQNFFDVLSLNPVGDKKLLVSSKKLSSVSDILGGNSVDQPDPIYSNFGRLKNGFYVSSKGVVFSSETEMMQFNTKMVEMDEKLKYELSVIQHQHNKLKAKAEEKKLLSQRTESHEESDHDEELRENLQLNRESNPKDKGERKSGLFASLTASLSAAKSGIQGFLEKSSPKQHRCSPRPVSMGDNEDSEDETGKLTQRPNSKVSTVDGIDNHDEFTREMQAKGGLMYESANKTIQHLSHDALPPPLSLEALQVADEPKE